MANRRQSVRIFSLLLILIQLEEQVRSQPSADQQQHQSEQLAFGAQEMFSPASQTLMDEMFQQSDGAVRGAISSAVAGEKTSPELVGNLIFQPSLLDFVERSIGDPHNQVVILINKHKNRSVFLGSISGSTPVFYSSYFKDMVIPPEGNTTFNVVFLPRRLGAATGSIEIHTSFGLLQYQVKGIGRECPYRLRPLVNLVAPLNATITPEITMYNPHDVPLQIMEIYSSGGNFQLELPSGAQEGPQAMWEIPPHSTRSVIRVRFHGKAAGNYTAYVRIKISGGNHEPSLVDKMLVVPIEVEIYKETGIYSKVPFIKFDTGRTTGNISQMHLNLTNSGDRKVEIQVMGVYTTSAEAAAAFKFYVSSDLHPTAEVRVDLSKIHADGEVSGFFYTDYTLNDPPDDVVYSCVIYFTCLVLKRNLKYNADALKFLTFVGGNAEEQHNSQLAVPRPLMVHNQFSVPFSISNISVPENCSSNFLIEGFRPRVLQPGQEETLLRISRILTDNLNRSIATYIRLMTNMSDFELPVYSYTGKLKRILPFSTTDSRLAADYEQLDLDEQELEFGILPISTIGETLIGFFNANPVEIPIRHWKGTITSDGAEGTSTITVILRGCGPYAGENLLFCHSIKPKHWMVFQISVQSGTTDSYRGQFSVTTDYEEIVTPISFTTAVGKLELNRELLRFDNCFPGKLCSLNLTAHSTFLTKIHVEGIKTDVDGIEFTVDSRHPVIHPNTVTNIGRLLFDPKVICKLDCYSSFDLLSKPFGVKWMATLDSYEQYSRLDSEKLLQQLRLYAEMKRAWKSIRFQLTTDPIRRFEFNASIDLVWPKLLTENIHFPTLQVEQEAVKLITINNPSDQILFVHLVLHDVSVHGNNISALPPEILSGCENCSLSEENVFSFFLFDYDDIYVNYVKPKSFLKIAVKFTSKTPGTFSTIFYMRNNLTLIDAVWIQARAVVPVFKFGNRKPGSATALQFEITEKHLKMCSKFQEPATEDDNEITIQTKRSFTARNSGEVPIAVSGIRVEEIFCEGFGFKVLDCAPFELQPNASKKIEIAFSPDFTLARVTRTLNFDTNINFPVNFTLLGTVPAHGLESCSLSLKRPWFEGLLRVVLICVLSLAFIGTLIAAFIDANKVIKEHVLSISRDRGPIQPPLDLRQIALQTSAAAIEDSSDNKSTGSQNSQARKSQNNNSKKRTPAKESNSKFSNGNANNYNKSWTDFTSKLGKGVHAKQTNDKPSPEADKRSQKSRRSITPPKEETQLLTPVSNCAPSTSISTKERNRPPAEEDTCSTATEISETSSTVSTASTVSSASSSGTSGYKATTSSDIAKSPRTANASTNHQHHAQSKTPTSDLKPDFNPTSPSQSHSINQQQSKTVQQQPQQPLVTQTQKLNVKKSKSLPAGYEAGASALNSANGGGNNNNYSQQKHATSATTPGKESNNGGHALRNNTSKNHSNDKGPGKSNKSADKREHSGKENGNAYAEHGGKNDSSQPKKFGKTPGRERKSNNQGKKGSKNLHKAQAITFTSAGTGKSGGGSGNGNSTASSFFLPSNNISTGPLPAPPNVWGENRARFSDVVAQATLDRSGGSKQFDSSGSSFTSSNTSVCSVISIKQQPQQQEAPKAVGNLFGKAKDDSFVGMEKELNVNVGTGLAPIGTSKKSPSSITPRSWEPFGNVVNSRAPAMPSVSTTDAVNSASYFSQSFIDYNQANSSDQFHSGGNVSNGNHSLADFHSQQSAFAGMNGSQAAANNMISTGLNPMNDLNPMIVDRSNWDDKYLWQIMHKDEDINPSTTAHWNSLWTSPTVFTQPNSNPNMQQQHPSQPSSMQMNSRLTNNWLNTAGSSRSSQMPLRAPPGFSPVKPTPNQALLAQAHVQQAQQDHQNNATGGATYDPFRLSSIWAPANTNNDAWNDKE
ncbi:transmembrane protein 131 homolog [Sabethes cyaneus]|uniref:transmembrane protein 131 homolog n=1 Tax=Sabethes cyaneus TaxID=53552 RepID=UPI00237DA596|nr:transmembrane protein 131 homolog [Sabethes cyaneus]